MTMMSAMMMTIPAEDNDDAQREPGSLQLTAGSYVILGWVTVTQEPTLTTGSCKNQWATRRKPLTSKS